MAKKPTLAKFAEMCKAKSANITNIASGFSVSRWSVYDWMKNPKWERAFDEVKESLLDFTESQQLLLIKGIPKYEEDENGNRKQVGWLERPSETLLIWFEKTRGKHRGYTDSVDHTTNGKDLPAAAPMVFVSADQLTPEQLQQYIDNNLNGVNNNNEST